MTHLPTASTLLLRVTSTTSASLSTRVISSILHIFLLFFNLLYVRFNHCKLSLEIGLLLFKLIHLFLNKKSFISHKYLLVDKVSPRSRIQSKVEIIGLTIQ
jgi:hypothetical protein